MKTYKYSNLFILSILLMLLPFYLSAGTQVDEDGDGLYCVIEDDGKYCNEDGQDRCDGIPNVSLNDNHCDMDRNGDGKFTIVDVKLIFSQNDHLITGIPYPNYIALGLPANFGGYVCFDIMRAIEYNKRLSESGLPLLQGAELFILVGYPPHCLGHHSYPAIE